MAKSKVVINTKVARKILREDSITVLEKEGRKIMALLPPGFEMRTVVGSNRARVTITAVTYAARRAEAKDGVLSKAIGQVR